MRWKSFHSALTAAIWVALGLASLILNEWSLTQLAQYMAYGIFAMGLAFIWGQAGILSFGQAIFFGIGGYCMGLVTLGQLPLVGDSTFVGLLLALVCHRLPPMCWAASSSTDAVWRAPILPSLRCARPSSSRHSRSNGRSSAASTVCWAFRPSSYHGEREADAYLTPTEIYFLMLAASLLVFLVLSYIIWSPVGTVLAAIRDNDQRTAFFGYDIVRYKVGAFASRPWYPASQARCS